MVQDHQEVIAIIYIGLVWGVCNPFIRKGTLDAEAKERLKQNNNEIDHEHEADKDGRHVEFGLVEENETNNLLLKQRQRKKTKSKSTTLSLEIEASEGDTFSQDSDFFSYGSIRKEHDIRIGDHLSSHQLSPGSALSSLKSDEMSTGTLEEIAPFSSATNNNNARRTTSPDTDFMTGIIKYLLMFKTPQVAIPYLMNNTCAYLYYKLLATSNLTSVAYCNALSMVISALTGHFLGERLSKPFKALLGAFMVTIGVVICMMADDIEELIVKYLNHQDDKNYNSLTEGTRTLLSSILLSSSSSSSPLVEL
jgi:hypothetical protein